MSFYIKWLSENYKWAITEVEKNITMSSVTVKNRRTRKNYIIKIEHIKVGDKLIDGSIATQNKNRIVADKMIPIYVKNKAIEFIV